MTHPRKQSSSVYRRKGQERWVVSITDPTTGKHIQKYARSEQDARQKRHETKSEIKQRRYNALQRGNFRREQRQ